MPEPETTPGAVHRSDEERAASFAELMRLEQRQNRPPVSGLAVGSLGFAAAFTGAAHVFGMFSLVIGAASVVFGVSALPQLRHRERRGFVILLAAVAVLVWGVLVIESEIGRVVGG